MWLDYIFICVGYIEGIRALCTRKEVIPTFKKTIDLGNVPVILWFRPPNGSK